MKNPIQKSSPAQSETPLYHIVCQKIMSGGNSEDQLYDLRKELMASGQLHESYNSNYITTGGYIALLTSAAAATYAGKYRWLNISAPEPEIITRRAVRRSENLMQRKSQNPQIRAATRPRSRLRAAGATAG
jgi:hypothetical protein